MLQLSIGKSRPILAKFPDITRTINCTAVHAINDFANIQMF